MSATDVPLIYTKNGNVPIDSLHYSVEWIVEPNRQDPERVTFREVWTDKITDEIVKESRAVHLLKVPAMVDVEQGRLGG